MTQVKFYRVETLPEVGEVGSLYFVYGSGGVQSLLYICVGTGLFELYTPDLYELENKLDSLKDSVSEVETKIDEQVAKQGENQEATNSKIYGTLNEIKGDVIDIMQSQLTEVDNLLDF
jgi:hypothetical protein